MGLSPQCSKGFFAWSQHSVQTLQCLCSLSVKLHASTSKWTVKMPTYCLATWKPCTHQQESVVLHQQESVVLHQQESVVLHLWLLSCNWVGRPKFPTRDIEVKKKRVNKYTVAGELCKLARVTGPEFPHPFSPVGRCLPVTGRCRVVRYKRQCLPSFCTVCWKVLVNPYPPPPPPPPPESTCWKVCYSSLS